MSELKKGFGKRKKLWKELTEFLEVLEYPGTKKDVTEHKIKTWLMKQLNKLGFKTETEITGEKMRADIVVDNTIPIEIKIITETNMNQKLKEAGGQIADYLKRYRFAIAYLWDKRRKSVDNKAITISTFPKKTAVVII